MTYVNKQGLTIFNMINMKSSNKIIGVRFSTEDAELLQRVCKARGEDISGFIRRAVRTDLAYLSFYTDIEKKALGVPRSHQEEQ